MHRSAPPSPQSSAMSYNPYLGEEPPASAYASMDVDDEYEGGQWIDGEFYYEKKRERRPHSKAQQLYGIFAGSDDEEEEEGKGSRSAARRRRQGLPMSDSDDEEEAEVGRRGLGASRRGDKKAAGGLLTRTMRFVGGSTAQQQDREERKQDDDDDEHDNADNRERRMETEAEGRREEKQERSDEEEEEEQRQRASTGLGFKRRRLAQQQHILKQKEPDAAASPSPPPLPSSSVSSRSASAQLPAGRPTHPVGGDFASRLLAKMGFRGRLGKNETGIATPILPVLRPKGAGLGTVKEKRDVRGRNAEEEEKIRQEEKEKKRKEQEAANKAKQDRAGGGAAAAGGAVQRGWRKGERKVRKVYKTAAELRQSSAASQPIIPPTVIIDMTSGTPVPKSLASVSSSPAPVLASSSASAVPELQHNVQLLVDLAEAEVQQVERRTQQVRAEIAELQQEEMRVKARAKREEEAAQRLERVMQEVASLQSAMEQSRQDTVESRMQRLDDFMQRVKQSFQREWRMYGLAQLCVVVLLPLVTELVQDWQPLPVAPSLSASQSSSRLFSALSRWRQRLDDSVSSVYYHELLSALVLPPLRLALSSSSLSLQQPEPIVTLFASLSRLLPSHLLSSLTHSLLLPRLLSFAKQQNPRTSSASSSASLSFLSQYASVLGDDDMQELYAVVRQKLGFVVGGWKLEDEAAGQQVADDEQQQSVLQQLRPWATIWRQEDTAAFLSRYVLPKLVNAVAGTRIDLSALSASSPAAALQLTVAASIMRWQPLFPAATFSSLLLPLLSRFLSALHSSLSSDAEPDYDAVSSSYTRWKSALASPGQETLPALSEGWRRGLDLINAALEGEREEAAAWKEVQRWMREAAAAPAASSASASAASAAKEEERKEAAKAGREAAGALRAAGGSGSVSYKEVLYALGERHGLDVFPHSRRRVAGSGQEVYQFGPLSIYWSGEDVYVMDEATRQWEMVSLNTLLQRAQQLQARQTKRAQQLLPASV